MDSRPAEFDLLSLGECLVEFSRDPDGRFCTGWAGDALNTLFYASRLGLRTGFVSTFGDDLFTGNMRAGIEREGIDLSLTQTLHGRNNGLYVIELDGAGEYTFHFWREGSAARETLLRLDPDTFLDYCSRTRWFLFSGITLAVMKERERLLPVLLRLRERGVRIAFDTNYRAALWTSAESYIGALESVLPMIDLFLPSQSDLRAVWTGSDPVAVVQQLSVPLVAMKCGVDGCLLVQDGEQQFQPAEQVPAIDTTGAGDAFNAGVITGLVRGWTLGDAAHLGQHTAAHVVGVRGALDMNFRDEERN